MGKRLGILSHPHPSPLPEGEGTRRAEWVIIVVLILGTFAFYARVAHFDFINFDDNVYVTQNPRIRNGLTYDNLIWSLTANVCANWHPLTLISYMLDVQIFGVKPGWMHLENVLLHAANAALLFIVLRRMTQALWPSAWVAAMFAWHPLHVESVAWIAERKDVLSTLFMMLCLLAYLRYVRKGGAKNYALVMAMLAPGLASKPMLVTMPAVLLLLDFWPLGRFWEGEAPAEPEARAASARREPRPPVTRLIVEKIPLFALVLVSAVVTYAVQFQSRSVSALPLRWRLMNAVVSYVEYLRQTICPRGLAIFYPLPWDIGSTISTPILIASVVGLVAITLVAILVREPQPWVLVGWLWYLGTLVPVIGIVQVGSQSHADHYTYIPLTGIFLALAWTGVWLAKRSRAIAPAIVVVAIATIVGAGVMSWRQIGFWRDSETVMRRAIDVVPANYLAHSNLGQVYDSRNDARDAIAEYREALRLNPNDPTALNNLSIHAMRDGNIDEAMELSRKAILANPVNGPAYVRYGDMLAQKGRRDDAIAVYRSALAHVPDFEPAYVSLGLALAQAGEMQEAVFLWQRAIQLDPKEADAHDALGQALLMQGQTRQGIAELRATLAIDPDRVDALNMLAWTMATHPNPLYQNGAEAEPLAQRAVDLTHSNDPIPLDTLAAAEAREGKFDQAAEDATRAIKLAQEQKAEDLSHKIRARVDLYRSHQAYSSGG